MLKAFSVYDTKSQAYSSPFFARTVGEGERMFSQEAKNPQSFMNKYPTDFTLYAVGEFCPDTGSILTYKDKVHLTSAHDALTGATQSADADTSIVS